MTPARPLLAAWFDGAALLLLLAEVEAAAPTDPVAILRHRLKQLRERRKRHFLAEWSPAGPPGQAA